MRLPSLRRRVIVAGVTMVVALVLALDGFVYLNLRDDLHATLQEVLAARAQLAGELAGRLDPEQLSARLTELGVPAEVRTPDGRVIVADPETIRQEGPPAGPRALPGPLLSDQVALRGGGSVMVFVTRSGVDATLRRVLVLEIIGSLAAVAVAVVVLGVVSDRVTRPLNDVVLTARRIAAGRTGERLDPERTDTELGRMAQAFDEMLDALEGALAEAQQSEERSRRFLADAAHQLRTPIAGIRASVETLLRRGRGSDPAENERLLANVARETARVGRLVTSLLRIAELDQGIHAARERVGLAGLARAEVDRARHQSPHLAFDLRTAALLPDVQADATSVREALANLLDNARRHAETSVTVTVDRSGGTAEVAVRDDGPGIPVGESEHVFERFVSLDGAGGSGLGLSIARAIARAHAGDVEFRHGAFVLWLPAADAERTGPARAGTPHDPAGTGTRRS